MAPGDELVCSSFPNFPTIYAMDLFDLADVSTCVRTRVRLCNIGFRLHCKLAFNSYILSRPASLSI